MEPIRNSIIKEKFRLYNDDVAQMKERDIHEQLEREIKVLYKKNIPPIGDYLVRGVIFGYFIAIFIGLANQSLSAFGIAWFFSLVGGGIIWGFKYVSIIEYNKSIEEKKLQSARRHKKGP